MLAKLASRLIQDFPQLQIAGSYAPPFRLLTLEEEKMDCDRIQASGAAVVFVALGCPKQEQWMARQQRQLNAVMIGVGAALVSIAAKPSNPAMDDAPGFRMVLPIHHRTRRLWRRYLINNPMFIVLVSWQLLNTSSSAVKQRLKYCALPLHGGAEFKLNSIFRDCMALRRTSISCWARNCTIGSCKILLTIPRVRASITSWCLSANSVPNEIGLSPALALEWTPPWCADC